MGNSVRIRFQVKEKARFISHLDKIRSFERAIRRAQLPIAYSQGFNRRPRFAFAQALAVGLTSDAEYMDLHLAQSQAAVQVCKALNQVLPSGFRVLNAVNLPAGTPALMSVVTAASYQFSLWESSKLLEGKIQEILNQKSLVIERHTKKGPRKVDIRPLIYQLQLIDQGTKLNLECACGSEGNVRPMDVLPLLDLNLQDVLIHRTALWVDDYQARLTPIDLVGRQPR